eukprot:2345486-Rhodomonas_salina.4
MVFRRVSTGHPSAKSAARFFFSEPDVVRHARSKGSRPDCPSAARCCALPASRPRSPSRSQCPGQRHNQPQHRTSSPGNHKRGPGTLVALSSLWHRQTLCQKRTLHSARGSKLGTCAFSKSLRKTIVASVSSNRSCVASQDSLGQFQTWRKKCKASSVGVVLLFALGQYRTRGRGCVGRGYLFSLHRLDLALEVCDLLLCLHLQRSLCQYCSSHIACAESSAVYVSTAHRIAHPGKGQYRASQNACADSSPAYILTSPRIQQQPSLCQYRTSHSARVGLWDGCRALESSSVRSW